MGRITYSMNVSLDGFVEDANHRLDWSSVDEELHTWFKDQLRASDAIVYGRRVWEVMDVWWTIDQDPNLEPFMLDFARVWVPIPKVVVSTTLERLDPPRPNARLVRSDPVGEVLRLRDEVEREVSIAGPTLAAEFVRRDLVDVYRLAIHPVVLGAGTPFWPALDRQLDLRLTESRQLASGVVLVAYERR